MPQILLLIYHNDLFLHVVKICRFSREMSRGTNITSQGMIGSQSIEVLDTHSMGFQSSVMVTLEVEQNLKQVRQAQVLLETAVSA